jgi:CBS domain-containing protein
VTITIFRSLISNPEDLSTKDRFELAGLILQQKFGALANLLFFLAFSHQSFIISPMHIVTTHRNTDLMSFPVITVTADTSMEKVARILKEKGCTGLPEVSKDRLVGMISRRDFRKLKKESQLRAPVKAFMATNILTIEPGKSPMQAARLMVKHDIGRLPVIENDRIIGIITRSDAMLYFYDLLPD